MNLHRLAIKFYAAGEPAFALRDCVPVFHSWIQKQAVSSHLLIDVHDYSHIHEGPGILLVAHQGNFSLDAGGGLLYNRKADVPADFNGGLTASVRAALEACRLLEADTGLRFRTDEALVIANDRLAAPNNIETLDRLEPAVSAAFRRMWPGGSLVVEAAASSPQERFALRVRAAQSESIQRLLDRLAS